MNKQKGGPPTFQSYKRGIIQNQIKCKNGNNKIGTQVSTLDVNVLDVNVYVVVSGGLNAS